MKKQARERLEPAKVEDLLYYDGKPIDYSKVEEFFARMMPQRRDGARVDTVDFAAFKQVSEQPQRSKNICVLGI